MAILKDTQINGDLTVNGNIKAGSLSAESQSFDQANYTFNKVEATELTVTSSLVCKYDGTDYYVANQLSTINRRLDNLGFKEATISVNDSNYFDSGSSIVRSLGKILYGQLSLKYPSANTGTSRPQSVKIITLNNIRCDFETLELFTHTATYTYNQTTITYTPSFKLNKLNETSAEVVVNFPKGTVNGAGMKAQSFLVTFWYDSSQASARLSCTYKLTA